MTCNTLMAVRVTGRSESALQMQKVLTEQGCKINMRLGMHDHEDGNVCSEAGVIILQLCCDPKDGKSIEEELNKIHGIKAHFIDI